MKKVPFISYILTALFTGMAVTSCRDELNGNETLDLQGASMRMGFGGLYVSGPENIIKNGSASGGHCDITNGELMLHSSFSCSNTTINLKGGATLDMGGIERSNSPIYVSGTGNTLKNGTFLDSLTLEEEGSLNADSIMSSWGGPKKIQMKNGSTLNMVGQDNWINNLSALQVTGTAIINGALLRVRSSQAPDHVYTLGNGVENLTGSGTYYVLTGDEGMDYFDLNGHTANFDIISWESEKEADIVVRNGTIDKHVEIRGLGPGRQHSKLNLQSVTIGDNATFSLGVGAQLVMGNGTTVAEGATFSLENTSKMDLGGAVVRLDRITLSSGAIASVSNFGALRVASGKTFTLEFAQNQPASVQYGNNARLHLDGDAKFSAGDMSQILISKESGAINLKVTADGRFDLGRLPQQIGEKTQVVRGNVDITYTGTGTTVAMEKDVDIYYQLVGSLKVTAANGRVNAGIIGMETDTSSTGAVEAKQVYLSGFVGKSLALKAANNGGEAIHVEANAMATDSLKLDAHVGDMYGDIVFGGKLSGSVIELNAKNIQGTGNSGDSQLPTFLDFSESCTINATGAIDIQEGFKGGELSMEAAGNIALDLLGTKDASLASADILSAAGGITMRAFTGENLKATAKEALTISNSVAASGNAELAGRSVSIAGPIAASGGSVNIASTAGNIIMQSGGTLSAGDSITLDSKGSIIGTEAHVLGGDLTATAVQSITLGSIGTAENAVGEAVLTAQVGSITARSFTGSTLKVSAKGDVSINGSVAALSGNAELTGNSVSIGGALAANNADASITSTAGVITLGGAVSAMGTITLDSANNINGQAADVQGGNLTATAAQSITLGNIGTAEKAVVDAVLTATNGHIMAASFTGAALQGTAKGSVTINGNVSASGDAELTGSSVSINGSLTSSGGSASIKSTTGNITLGGALSTGVSGTLDSAVDITVLGDVTGGGLTATAGNSITLGLFNGGDLAATAGDSISLANIGTAEEAAGAVALTAQGEKGAITAGAFTGASLKATAKGAVTFSGPVTASGGNVELAGGSVSIQGALTANNAIANIQGTDGNIEIAGDLSAKDFSTLDSAGSIIVTGDVLGGTLTATAADSITLGNISIGSNETLLTATSGSITAGSVTVGKLTVSAHGNVQLGDVSAGQEGAVIASTSGSVELNSFSGAGAQISALNGSIQVKSAVSGSGNTFLAGQSIAFAAAACEGGLSNATLRAPQVAWVNGTTLSNVTLAGQTDSAGAQVAVGGSLTLKDSSVMGAVNINAANAKLTVDHSTVTGEVSGTNAIGLELDNGAIGGAGNLASLSSTGTSCIAGLADELVIPILTLNGGSLTLSGPQTESGGAQGQALVSTLTVTQPSQLNADLELSNDATLNLTLDAENASTPLLAVNGQLTSETFLPFLTINLAGDDSVESGKSYALISVKDGQTPDFWDMAVPFMTVTGMGATVDDLSWKDGILYFQNGTELKTAVWSPTETSHLWNTTDKNWTQDGHRYRYLDGVDVVFNDTGAGGEVHLEGELAPKSVLVEGACDYTFKGTGKITGEAALTKNGNGTLTIENANDYSGGTFINGGTLVMKNDHALGFGTVTMGAGATLNLGGCTLGNSVVLAGIATIGNGSVNGDVEVASDKALHLGDALNVSGTVSGSGTLVKDDDGGTATVTGSMQSFTGNVEVQGGTLNLMNMAEAARLNVADVTINNGTLGVYKGETAAEANEGTLTISSSHKLAAGKEARLNANLVMQSNSTLDVSATEGMGLLMGSSVTLSTGISLSSLDLENVYGLTEGASYNLFSGVDALTMDKTYTEAFAPDVRIDAAGWFRGVDAEHIYVTYDGSNVGLYCMVPMPEPTTGTLSLLALAALAARRRRK